LARLEQLLTAVRSGESASLVLRGEAGIGKTALLDYAAKQADDARIVRAVGVESEMELAYAALHQLCLPLINDLDSLPEPQREALATAFGLSSGHPPNRFLVGLAVLSLLSAAGEAQPLICLVDDAQWLDESSGRVLSFVARRLQAESVLLLFAERDESEPTGLIGLPELRIRGLSEGSSREFLAGTHAAPLDEAVRDQIIAETRGNPLALLELPRMIAAGDLAGGFAVPGSLHGQLEASFRRQFDELPIETQGLLLLAAAEPTGDPTLLSRAADELDFPIEAAAPAEQAGLLELGPRVTFRHPLLRNVIYDAAAPGLRRVAHAALAVATDPELDSDRRAWHRAQATPLPDEQVAFELEQSAERARARGGLAAAAAFLERSMVLSPDAQRRAARALAAAELKHDAGAFDAARGLVLEAESGPLDELQQAQAQRLRGRIAFASTRDADAPRVILAAAERLRALDEELARDTYLEALQAANYVGQPATLQEVARALPPEWASQQPRALELLMIGKAQRTLDGDPAGAELLARGLEAMRTEKMSPENELHALNIAARAALVDWDIDTAETLSERYVQLAREQGALAVLPSALELLGVIRVFTGEFVAARIAAIEGDTIAVVTGAPPLQHLDLLVGAWCDPPGRALKRIRAFLSEVDGKGWAESVNYIEHVAAILHNGCGEYAAALEAAQRARRIGAVTSTASTTQLTELIEAAVRCGERETAVTALSEFVARSNMAGDAARALEARGEALLSEGDKAETLYRESIERLSGTRLRSMLARSHLVYGEWLRREKRRVDAREQLRLAYELFLSMGVAAFTERARRELAATGERARKRAPETRDDLTPQETQIARLAADGYTNPEIGARLFLSPRTVEYHLRKVYPKLGLSSRWQLRSVFEHRRTLP
jgi:DNA-binding CsgD family transcriptional regulator